MLDWRLEIGAGSSHLFFPSAGAFFFVFESSEIQLHNSQPPWMVNSDLRLTRYGLSRTRGLSTRREEEDTRRGKKGKEGGTGLGERGEGGERFGWVMMGNDG